MMLKDEHKIDEEFQHLWGDSTIYILKGTRAEIVWCLNPDEIGKEYIVPNNVAIEATTIRLSDDEMELQHLYWLVKVPDLLGIKHATTYKVMAADVKEFPNFSAERRKLGRIHDLENELRADCMAKAEAFAIEIAGDTKALHRLVQNTPCPTTQDFLLDLIDRAEKRAAKKEKANA